MKPQEGLALVMTACDTIIRDDRACSLVLKAITAAEANNVDAAIKSARSATMIAPSYVDARVVLGDLMLYDASKRDVALEQFRQVIAHDPVNSLAVWHLALEEMRKGETLVALAMLSAAVEDQPTDTYVVVTLMWLLQMAGRGDEAEALVQNRLLSPPPGLICDTLIRLFRSRVNTDEAPLRGRPRTSTIRTWHSLDRMCRKNIIRRSSPKGGMGKQGIHAAVVPSTAKDSLCLHLINPKLEVCKARYGSRVARHYQQTFHSQILDPEINMAIRPSAVADQHVKNSAGTRIPSEMVFVPGGRYTIGRNQPNLNNPERQCTIPSFLIDRHPVTNGQWREFRSSHQYPKELENHPVVNVHFVEAILYARSRGKRLPSETEWEAAARGREGWPYPWGRAPDPTRINCAEKKLQKTTSVTNFPRGASSCGALDMMGNVQEWVDEWGPPAKKGRPHARVTKGGGRGVPASGLQCWIRNFAVSLTKNANIGFRCVKDLE